MNEEAGTLNPALVLMMKNDRSGRAECMMKNGNTAVCSRSCTGLLEEWCLKCGCTMKGRQEAFRQLTGTKQKTPVLISECTGRIFFPLLSQDDPECIWLCFNEILNLRSGGSGISMITFLNGREIRIPYDPRVVSRQIRRCETFLITISQNL